MPGERNVLGGTLQACCYQPMTGYYRDGYCRIGNSDYGVHAVCVQVTSEFLAFSQSRGNDLSTPHPPSFPGLQPGDRWCVCASRWREALEAGVAAPILLQSTHESMLDYVSLDQLKEKAVDWDQENNTVRHLANGMNGHA